MSAKQIELKEKYSWGNDIEFHLYDKTKKKFVSAIEVLKCDKYNPIDLGDGIKVYADNILIETSFPPYYSKKEMFHRFKTVFTRIQKLLGKNYQIVPKAAHVYDDAELQDPKALEAGCSANYNAYNVSINPPTEFKGGLRSAGLHYHTGAKYLLDFQNRIDFIKLMDIFLGTSSVIFNPDKTEKARRSLYGKSSEHRPTSFGAEYRCLSPKVLSSRAKTSLAFDLVNHTLSRMEKGETKKILDSVDAKLVQKAIDNCDKKAAIRVLKSAKLPSYLMRRVVAKHKNNFNKAWGLSKVLA